MFISAHIAAGLVVGKLTGSYTLALVSALVVDVDHLIPYVKYGIIFSPKKLRSVITDPEDPYGDQRNVFHSFFTWILITSIILMIDYHTGIVVGVGYLSHLLLDLLDGSDFYPFYPIKKNIRGPIPYLSRAEFLFTALLVVVFIILG